MNGDLQSALLAHPRILRARISEHIYFDSDDVVGVSVTVARLPNWRDDVRVWSYFDRSFLDDAGFLASFMVKQADDWVKDGAPQAESSIELEFTE